MAPAFPIDYTGPRESTNFSKRGSGDMMGKTRKVSKGSSTGFIPDYRHAVETVTASESYGNSRHGDVELAASQDPCAPSKKCINLNVDVFDRSVMPIENLCLSKMSPLERRDLEIRLKRDLEKVKELQTKIASFSPSATVPLPATDVHTYSHEPKAHSKIKNFPMSTNSDELMSAQKKKMPSGKNGPRTKGGPVEANINGLVKPGLQQSAKVNQGRPQSTSFVMWKKQCETLLTRIMEHQHSWIFNEPVDIVKHNVPDYFNVIKQPMDLGTVKNKLRLNQYNNPMEFAADVRLTFKNAMTFNPEGHIVHSMADTLSKFFEMRWKPIEKKIQSTLDESTASKSSVVRETGSVYLPPAKKQKITSMENNVKREKDKRVMSDDEKQKLSADLEELVEELPDNITSFLKESSSNCSQVSEDEIEIEIGTLSDETLFTLRKLLDDYVMEKQKKQTAPEPCKIEMRKESEFNSLSIQPCKENEPADEDVDIGINDPPPTSCSPPINLDEDPSGRNNKCISSRSFDNDSASPPAGTDSKSAAKLAGDKNSFHGSIMNEIADAKVKREKRDQNSEDFSTENAERDAESNPKSMEPRCQEEGGSAPLERQVSPDKLYRAALLRSRFADIIIKAQENTIGKGERPDPERLKRERDEIERRRKEEKARLQAEAKAAEDARRKAEAEAAAIAKRKRELEREAARQALLKMEKTVDINENSQFMEDLEMFRSAEDEPLLQSFVEVASPESCQDGLGSYKFQSSNPLEQLGLYMKNDDEDEEEIEPQRDLVTSHDPEEGEID